MLVVVDQINLTFVNSFHNHQIICWSLSVCKCVTKVIFITSGLKEKRKMDTSQCDGIKFQYDLCINDKLSAMKTQKPDVDCEEMFEKWRDCYSAAVKTFIAKSKENKGK